MTIETEQIGLRLKLELVNKLRSYCTEEGRSQTWVIDKALNQYLGISADAKSLVTCKAVVKPVVNKQVVIVDDIEADYVIDCLNIRAGTKYRYTDTNRKIINARLKHYSYLDACTVIDKKCLEWEGTEMARYLRPSTLFNATKFEEYLNQDINNKSKQIQQGSTRTRDRAIADQLTNTDWAE